MNPRDLAVIVNKRRYPGLPLTPGIVTGEQTKFGVPMVRLSWPDRAAWVAVRDVLPVAKVA